MVLVYKWPFSNFYFLGNISQENVFYDILHRKIALVAYKKNSLKSQKTDIFLNGLTHGFGLKIAAFPTFSFWQYRPGKCLLRYSRRKNVFLGYKNKKFKKSKNFWSKNGPCSNFFFLRQYRPGKCLLRYCRTKKRPSSL